VNLINQSLIGKASKINIYSPWGVLLLPSHTRITKEHIKKLQKHDITLNRSEVTDYNPSKYLEVIDRAVPRVKDVFNEVRQTLKIPLEQLQDNVVPIITDITDGSHLINLFSSLQAKDDYTYRHNLAVGAISNLIGKWLDLAEDEVVELSLAGLLHDVGKMRIPETILNKPGRLTDEEFDEMKKHTIYGYELIKETPGSNYLHALIALQHHERMDGSGYPFGLTGDKIHLFSRIVSVADVFHAMSSKRIYKDALPFYEILFQMNQDSFGILDPKITRLFIERTMDSLIGNSVVLTDGREGTIIMVHKNDPLHPILQIDDSYVDLRENSSIFIEKVM